ncbi:MAG TPA: hypothetical protein VL282_02470 [Tepidisphaeraceae bacterium]|nr:hypothetical protein [Tepidisphaeraceae bacterium]
MSIQQFWDQLHEGGRVTVADALPIESKDLARAIEETDAVWRLELAFDPPALVMHAATWAALRIYRACQFLVYREIDAETVARDLKMACPDAPSPAVCYSVDLAFRALPDLSNLARAISPEDVLAKGIAELGRQWPLSSVGMQDIGDVDADPFIEDRSLRQLYVDRIIERQDVSRLKDERVKRAVRGALAGVPEFASRFESALK